MKVEITKHSCRDGNANSQTVADVFEAFIADITILAEHETAAPPTFSSVPPVP